MKYLHLLCILLSASMLRSQTVSILDANDGAGYLSQDEFDGFFDDITPLDIAIQLQDSDVLQMDRSEAVQRYKASFIQEVASFSEEDALRLKFLFDTLCREVNALHDGILPDSLFLIALNGSHYGDGAFYTRGKAIAIPLEMLSNMPPEAFKYVMYHELFHIISRMHPGLRHELYALVGYKPMDHVHLHPSMAERQLLNPDGTNINYAIQLQTDTSTAALETYIPIIYSTTAGLDPARESFFSYLDFKLLRVIAQDDGWHSEDFSSLQGQVMEQVIPAYFDRIGMNTQYIIHPDEILADNFMYLYRTHEENQGLDHQLLTAIRNVITNYK